MNKSLRHGYLNCPTGQIVMACLLFALTSSTLAAAQWQVKDFEIFMGPPQPYGDYFEELHDFDLDTVREYIDASFQEETLKMEHFLHDVAVQYEQMGFADPVASGHLKPVYRQLTLNKKIRVYMTDITKWNSSLTRGNVALAYYVDKCSNMEQYNALVIHRPSAFKNGKFLQSTYQSLAHELFHAVQAASNFTTSSNKCNIGHWITEGTADAIAFDMARQLRGYTFPEWLNNPGFAKIWGSRQYNLPLSTRTPGPTGLNEYLTSSFWRHLAEVTRANMGGKDHPGSDEAEVDYKYLAKLMATRLPGSGPKFEIQWVSDWIRGYRYILRDLSQVYAQFTASIADYWAPGKRIKNVQISAGDMENKWRELVFGTCKLILIPTPTSLGAPFDIPIEKNSARCFEVVVAGPAVAAELVIQEIALPDAIREQLRIGAVGGHLVAGPFMLDQAPHKAKIDPKYGPLPIWRFPITMGIANIFVISNMAKNAEDTVRADVKLHVSNPDWGSSMTTTAENSPASKAGKPRQPKTRADASKHVRAMRANPTTRSAMAALASRDSAEADGSCEGQMKIANLCGPQLRITLVKDSGIPGFGFVGGAGGIMKQMEASGAAFELDDQFQLESLSGLAQQNEGRMIELSIPLVDYGFQGIVKNAEVHVSKGSAGNFMAVQRTPDSNGFYPPNGSVTIDEYSPMLLSGRFSASLVDSEAVRNIMGSNPVLPPAGNITGSFVVSAPWRGSNFNPEFSSDSLMMNDMVQDMMSMLMKIPPELRSTLFTGDKLDGLCEMGFTDEQLAALDIVGSCSDRGSVGMAVVEPECSCICDLFEMEKNQVKCQQQCASTWILEQCGVDASADPELARYEAESGKLKLPKQLHKVQVANFQNSSPQVRELLWQELERLKQRLGVE